MSKRVCVVGLGYIGLPTSVIFAEHGWDVTGVDINPMVVNELNKGKTHIKENGLNELYSKVIKEEKFIARISPVEADVFIITVPTPHNSNLTVNLRYVEKAVESILPVLRKGNTIIIESTIPPRTTRDIVAPIIDNAGFKPGKDAFLAHCPERVLPGKILEELIENNRIVGGINSVSTKFAADVYRGFVKGKIIETSAESAEMSKLMENTYRDVNIALANELTKISEKLNINALEVISLANEHPRVNIHSPGPGVGGHCIAVDPYFIMEKDAENTQLIKRARKVNESMPSFVVERVKNLAKFTEPVAVFGLAYKGNVDDIRNSPSLEIINLLRDEGYLVKAHDPYVKEGLVDFQIYSLEEALKGAGLLLILTDHNEFKYIDWERAAELMDSPNILDTKNCIVDHMDAKVNYYNFGNLHDITSDLKSYVF